LASADSSEVAGLTGRSEPDWRRSAASLPHNPMGVPGRFHFHGVENPVWIFHIAPAPLCRAQLAAHITFYIELADAIAACSPRQDCANEEKRKC